MRHWVRADTPMKIVQPGRGTAAHCSGHRRFVHASRPCVTFHANRTGHKAPNLRKNAHRRCRSRRLRWKNRDTHPCASSSGSSMRCEGRHASTLGPQKSAIERALNLHWPPSPAQLITSRHPKNLALNEPLFSWAPFTSGPQWPATFSESAAHNFESAGRFFETGVSNPSNRRSRRRLSRSPRRL